MKKIILLVATLCLLLVVLAGCNDSPSYADGITTADAEAIMVNDVLQSIPIGVVDMEPPKTVGFYIADGESSAMVILQENNDFVLQGSEYISFMPSGKYRIDNGKLFLSMGDYDIIFLMEEDRLIFESGTWLEYWVEIGTAFLIGN